MKNKYKKFMQQQLHVDGNENLFNEKYIPNFLDKEVLDSFYEGYIYNLKKLYKNLKWVHLDDIESMKYSEWSVIGDQFLKNLNHIELAKDIIKNGTYWPLITKKENNKIILTDGVHRLYALKEAQKNGMWDKNKKVLIYVHPEQTQKEKIIYKVPSPLTMKSYVLGLFMFFYKGIIKNKEKKYIDENNFFLEVEESESILFLNIYSLLLRNAFFQYNQENNDNFKGSLFVNDESFFKKWREENENG